MSNHVNMIFQVKEKLKLSFNEKCKENNMTSSFVLRKLMQIYITNDNIINDSYSDIAKSFKDSIKIIEQRSITKLENKMSEFDNMMKEMKKQTELTNVSTSENLVDIFFNLIKEDRALQMNSYKDIEAALISLYPEYKDQLLYLKSRAKDPISECITKLRLEKLCDYNYKSKRITWSA